MTQKLKISIMDVVMKEEEISAQAAADILFDKYVCGNISDWEKIEGCIPTTLRRDGLEWYCVIRAKVWSSKRPATPDEIRVWHLSECLKCISDEYTETDALKDKFLSETYLDGKEIILEVVDE